MRAVSHGLAASPAHKALQCQLSTLGCAARQTAPLTQEAMERSCVELQHSCLLLQLPGLSQRRSCLQVRAAACAKAATVLVDRWQSQLKLRLAVLQKGGAALQRR